MYWVDGWRVDDGRTGGYGLSFWAPDRDRLKEGDVVYFVIKNTGWLKFVHIPRYSNANGMQDSNLLEVLKQIPSSLHMIAIEAHRAQISYWHVRIEKMQYRHQQLTRDFDVTLTTLTTMTRTIRARRRRRR